MSNYTPVNDYSEKDALPENDVEKYILGSDIDSELDGIAAAIASKLDASTYTAADVLSKVSTVDGSGSGLDADKVDGVEAAALAKIGTTNTFTGDQTITGNLSVSGTATVAALTIGSTGLIVLKGSGTFDFPSMADGAQSGTTATLTGAVVGDCIAVGTSVGPNLVPFAYVSATDTVTYGFRNASGGAIDPASCTFKFTIFR